MRGSLLILPLLPLASASSKPCLSEYLPDHLRDTDNYSYYFTPLSAEEYPVVNLHHKSDLLVFLPNQKADPARYNRDIFLVPEGDIEDTLFFGLKDRNGNNIIIDFPNRCAVSVNDRKTFKGFPSVKAWFSYTNYKEASGTLFLPNRDPTFFPLNDGGLEEHLVSIQGPAEYVVTGKWPFITWKTDLSDVIQAVRSQRVRLTAFFAYQGGMAIFGLASAIRIFMFRDSLKEFGPQMVELRSRDRSEISDAQAALISIGDRFDKLEMVEAWHAIGSFGFHTKFTDFKTGSDPYIDRFIIRLLLEIFSGISIAEAVALDVSPPLEP